MQSVFLPVSMVEDMLNFARERDYAHAVAILERGEPGDVIFTCERDVRIIDQLMEMRVLDVSLRNPFYNEDDAFFNPVHEDRFDDINAGELQKYGLTMGRVHDYKWPLQTKAQRPADSGKA